MTTAKKGATGAKASGKEKAPPKATGRSTGKGDAQTTKARGKSG